MADVNLSRLVGGSGEPIGTIKTMLPNNTSGTAAYTDEFNQVWLPCGVVETNVSVYPDAFVNYYNELVTTAQTGTIGANATDVTTDGTNLWVTSVSNNAVYLYDTATLTYQSSSFSTSTQVTTPSGITYNGANIFVMDSANNDVEEYQTDGTYVGNAFSFAAQTTQAKCMCYGNNKFFILEDFQQNKVHIYDASGVFQSSIEPISVSSAEGMFHDGTYLYVRELDTLNFLQYTDSGDWTGNYITRPEYTGQGGEYANGSFYGVTTGELIDKNSECVGIPRLQGPTTSNGDDLIYFIRVA